MFTRTEKEIATSIFILQPDSYEWANFKRVEYQHFSE